MEKLIDADAAIDALKELTANGTNKGMVFGEDAVHRIEMLPSVQPNTTTYDSIPVETGKNDEDRTTNDLISRQAAIEVLRNRWIKTRNYEGIGEDIAEECEIYLKTLPPAQTELIEKAAYIRGFEQGRTQGMIDAQGGKK